MVNIREHNKKRQMVKPTKKTLIFAVFFIILIVAPVVLNQYYLYLLSPVSTQKNEAENIFVITPGQGIGAISQNLKKQNLIRNAFAFRLLVAQMGIGKSIQAGDFKISPSLGAHDIAQELTHGAIDVWITLPEGLRIEEQAERIEQKLKFGESTNYNFDKKEYLKMAREGYMFPDTYLIPKDATARQVADRLTQTFDQKVRSTILDKSKSKLTADQIVTLASLIEKEAKTSEEKTTIAGIIMNRLSAKMALQIDAAVAYAKGYNSDKKTWWDFVTTDDYKDVKSPYNTYLNTGLPPGPIDSPGIDSIKAALNPADTEYLYYLHDAQGKIHYAKTAEEHNKNIQDFL